MVMRIARMRSSRFGFLMLANSLLTILSMIVHTCSDGLRSGDLAGHLTVLMPILLRKASVDLAVCGVALSC